LIPANAGLAVDGAAAGDILGFTLGSGDLNGDGVPDLVIGAPFSNDGVADRGAVYALFGGSGFLSNRQLDMAIDLPEMFVRGANQSEHLAEAMAVGDHNGDGLMDLILSAPRFSRGSTSETGRVVVISGAETDSDHDGIPNRVDDCPLVFDPAQTDADGDGIGDACDTDDDGDGSPNLGDCAPLDPQVHSEPGEVADLRFDATGTTLGWSPPADSGGASSVRYDVLLSDRVTGFPSAVCIESDDATDTTATTTWQPELREAHYYLVRAENGCGGSLGRNTSGQTRQGRLCP
jgi:hypothetical protein